MELVLGFVAGFVTDLLRSVFLPASTRWLGRRIPSEKKKIDIQDNVLTLEIMERLKAIGKDPDLALHARGDAEEFVKVLTTQREAFVENSLDVIESSGARTQNEMYLDSVHRAQMASLQLQQATILLESADCLTPHQKHALAESQEHWEKYVSAQSEFAGASYGGGTMAQTAYHAELERVTISRTAELRRIYEQMKIFG